MRIDHLESKYLRKNTRQSFALNLASTLHDLLQDFDTKAYNTCRPSVSTPWNRLNLPESCLCTGLTFQHAGKGPSGTFELVLGRKHQHLYDACRSLARLSPPIALRRCWIFSKAYPQNHSQGEERAHSLSVLPVTEGDISRSDEHCWES